MHASVAGAPIVPALPEGTTADRGADDAGVAEAEGAEEFAELAAIPANGAVHRSMGGHEGLAQCREHLVPQNLVQHRIGLAEGLDESYLVGIAVDAKPLRDGERRCVHYAFGDCALRAPQMQL